ncbi:MAG: IPT/TIG domain-containing protein [Proteobacteria bacterium]|nr:IPT/TIG domain-containing protein [Pseudomonadota bacterium]
MKLGKYAFILSALLCVSCGSDDPDTPDVDCTKTPNDPKCQSTEVDCTKTPNDPKCQTQVDCTKTPNDPKCQTEVDCTKTPNDPKCQTEVDCTKTPNDPKCQSTEVDCTKTPNDPKCQTTPPTNVDVPAISAMTPTSGKVGDDITITGKKLADVKEVCFASNCAKVASAAADKVVVKAPDGKGTVEVTLTAGNQRLSAGMFSYLTPSDNVNTVDWCQLKYVNPSITNADDVEAYAEVYEEGITGASGTHEGLIGQIGYGPANNATLENMKWVDAKRNDQFSSEASGNNDEYMADGLKLDAATYRIAYRFSLDGIHWSYCDYDGTDNGFDLNNTATVIVATPKIEVKTVGWCRIVNGETNLSTVEGEDSPEVYAQAFVEGCTDYQNHCADLKAQIGYGSPALTTELLDEQFTWKDAEINPNYDGSGGEKHDEFMAHVNIDKAETYSILYRLSLDNGKTWTYCDTSDDLNFNTADAIKLTVSAKSDPEIQVPPDPPVEQLTSDELIAWCAVYSPDVVNVRANNETELIFGRVYVAGCTEGQKCEKIKAQAAYGDPSDINSFKDFVDATYNDQAYNVGNNNEYYVTFKPDKAGKYGIIYRFSADDGKTWKNCDHSMLHEFSADKALEMNVTEDKDVIGWCRTQHPQSIEIVEGDKTENIYGQVNVEGCTNKEGVCDIVSAQVGYGTGDPSKDDTNYTFVDATYNIDFYDNDEYMASLTPEKAGEYRIVYRFKTATSPDWVYCDYDDENGFDVEKTSTLTVAQKAGEEELKEGEKYEYGSNGYTCRIVEAQKESTTAEETMLFGQIWVKDCTNNRKECPNIVGAHVHYEITGSKNDKYATWPNVLDATFNFSSNAEYNNSEYMITHQFEKGEYKYVYSFDLKRDPKDPKEKAQRVYCRTSTDTDWPQIEAETTEGYGVLTVK